MRTSVAAAAAAIPEGPSFLERLVNQALAEEMTIRWPVAEVVLRHHLPLHGWERLDSATTRRVISPSTQNGATTALNCFNPTGPINMACSRK